MSEITVTRYKGKQGLKYIEELAKLRILIFKEYPYLYQGDLHYEMEYLKTYAGCSEAILVVAQYQDNIIGVSTAIPLQFETAECQHPFIEQGLPINEFFYLGESVLLPQYRGSGIYRDFFRERETAAKEFGSKNTTFCAVVRDPKDARRPSGYTPLDSIWHHFGYEQHPELSTHYEWQEIDEKHKTRKPMTFWIKNLCLP